MLSYQLFKFGEIYEKQNFWILASGSVMVRLVHFTLAIRTLKIILH